MAIRWDKFTVKAQEAVQRANQLASEHGNPELRPIHLLAALLEDKEGIVPPVLEKIGIGPQAVLSSVYKEIEKLPKVSGEAAQAMLSNEVNKLLEQAFKEASNFKDEYVSTEHLLLAITHLKRDIAHQVLAAHGATYDAILKALTVVRGSQKVTDQNPEVKFQALDKYARDLTEQARRGKLDPVIGRDEEIRRVIQVLSRRTKNNPVLIGDPGVGKTAIVEGLARKIVAGEVPELLKNKRVISLDIPSLVAGTKYRGEFEDRMKKFLAEMKTAGNTVILFIDELHNVVGAGSAEGSSIDAANILKPALSRGELQTIGATTLGEYHKYIEKDPALERRFQPIVVSESTIPESIEILKGLRDRYEAHHQVTITDAAIEAAVRLSVKYITSRFLPDKAVDLMDEASAKVRLASTVPSDEYRQLQDELDKIEREKDDAIRNQEFEKAAGLRDQERDVHDKIETMKGSSFVASAAREAVVSPDDIRAVVALW